MTARTVVTPMLLILVAGGLWLTRSRSPEDAPPAPPATERPSAPTVAVTMETELGTIRLAIDTLNAPITGTNFLRYVDAGLYDGGTFYRTVRLDNQPDDSVRIEVIQGGIYRGRRNEAFEAIPMEPTGVTGILHEDGVISMARSERDTARGEFFIVIGSQPDLDQGGRRHPDGWGFATFGRVVEGMDVVHRIHEQPAEGQYFATESRIRILSVRREP